MTRRFSSAKVILVLTALLATGAFAQERPKSREEAEALISTLKFQQGQISLRDGLAALNVPPGFRFLGSDDASTVVFQLWGNPPGEKPLGLLMNQADPLSRESWAVIINYSEDGYVKDKDAEKIDYDKLLAEMKSDLQSANPERTKKGYPTMDLVGWAAPPRYDRATHKLYWAKKLKFGGETEDTLNYNIRMLGRRGVLVLNAVATMELLPEIERATPQILAAIDFNQGSRYADFSESGGDKVAKYGVAALVAGGIAAKAGLFKGFWLALLAAKKFIIIGVAAVAAWFRKIFGKRKAETTVDCSPDSA